MPILEGSSQEHRSDQIHRLAGTPVITKAALFKAGHGECLFVAGGNDPATQIGIEVEMSLGFTPISHPLQEWRANPSVFGLLEGIFWPPRVPCPGGVVLVAGSGAIVPSE